MLAALRFLSPGFWFLSAIAGICLLSGLSIKILRLDVWLFPSQITLAQIWLAIFLASTIGTIVLILSSRMLVRFILKTRIVDETGETKEQQLKLILEQQSQQANISIPQLAVYQSEDLNAFAVGHSQDHAMVVVSQGLLEHLNLDELSAVTGHEITHIANGDMLNLSVMQGVLNVCIYLPAKLLSLVFDKLFFRDWAYAPVYRYSAQVLQILAGGLTNLLVLWFSRQREFRADAGGAALAGQAEMLAALRGLRNGESKQVAYQPLTSFGLNGTLFENKLSTLLRSHPSLAERIDALQKASP
ncbi:MAG: M48 family metalloprotease [Gammaproteobacteria bacterium]|nr:M48 family metalloprotease [Gammaproteobacteria bacterium]